MADQTTTEDLINAAGLRVITELMKLQNLADEATNADESTVNYVAFYRNRKEISSALTDAKKAYDEMLGERAIAARAEIKRRLAGQMHLDDLPEAEEDANVAEPQDAVAQAEAVAAGAAYLGLMPPDAGPRLLAEGNG